MRAALFALLFACVAATGASCKQRVDDEDHAFVLARLRDYRYQMCAGNDAPCAVRVQTALTRWSASLGDGAAHPTEAQAKQLAELATQYGACLTKILVPEPPVTAPAVDAAVEK